MSKKISRLVPASIREAVNNIHECAQVANAQIQMKEDLMVQCLCAMQQMMAQNGCGDVEMEFTDGAAMFMLSSLDDYLDGEPFAAFAGEGDDGEYIILIRVYEDEDDEDEEDEDEEDEQTISVDSQLLRQDAGLTYVLGEEGWELADLEEEDED